MKRSLLVQTLIDMATGSGGAKLEALVVDAAGTFDAGSGKGYNPVTVPSGSVNVLGEKGVVSNNSVVITPKAQIVGGWLNSEETSGSGVGVTASELVSGTMSVTANGTFDVTNYKDVAVNISASLSSYSFTGSTFPMATITWDYLNKPSVTIFVEVFQYGANTGLVASIPVTISQNATINVTYLGISSGQISFLQANYTLNGNTLLIGGGIVNGYQYTLYAIA